MEQEKLVRTRDNNNRTKIEIEFWRAIIDSTVNGPDNFSL